MPIKHVYQRVLHVHDDVARPAAILVVHGITITWNNLTFECYINITLIYLGLLPHLGRAHVPGPGHAFCHILSIKCCLFLPAKKDMFQAAKDLSQILLLPMFDTGRRMWWVVTFVLFFISLSLFLLMATSAKEHVDLFGLVRSKMCKAT